MSAEALIDHAEVLLDPAGKPCSPDADRKAWIDAHRLGIGASEAAVVLGVRSYGRSPAELYLSKLGTDGFVLDLDEDPGSAPGDEDADGPEEGAEEPEYLWLGNELEPFVARAYERDTGRKLTRLQWLLRSREHPSLICTPDYLLDPASPPVPVDMKTSGTLGDWREGVPRWIWIQLQHQMAVLGAPSASVGLLAGGHQGMAFRWADVERDERFICENLVPACDAFMERVRKQLGPSIDDSRSCAKALARLYPEDTGATVELDGDWTLIDEDLVEIKAQQKELEARRLEYESRLKAAIGEATCAVLPTGARYTWKKQTTVRKPQPERIIEMRVLRRKAPKE